MGHGTMDRGESSGVSASELAAMGMCEHAGWLGSPPRTEGLRRAARSASGACACTPHSTRRPRQAAGGAGASSRPTSSEVPPRKPRSCDAIGTACCTSGPGCRLIVWYYRAAPLVCAWLCRHPWACAPASPRPVADGLVQVALPAHGGASCPLKWSSHAGLLSACCCGAQRWLMGRPTAGPAFRRAARRAHLQRAAFPRRGARGDFSEGRRAYRRRDGSSALSIQ